MNTRAIRAELDSILRKIQADARASGLPVAPAPDLTSDETLARSLQDLGLDSLSAVALVTHVEDRFDIELSPLILLECRTIGELIVVVANSQAERRRCA